MTRGLFNVYARNYSVYTLPIAWMLAQSVSVQVPLQILGLGPSISSRDELSSATSQLPPAEVAKLKRRDAARQNGLDNFPLFATAIIVGNDAGLEAGLLNAVGLGYLLSRGLYTWLSITVTKDKSSYIRLNSFWSSVVN